MKYLPLIWANLLRKKTRTLLTMLSIMVAFVLYGYLSAIERALDQGVSVAGADRLIVRHRKSIINPLPQSYQARIAQLPGVAAAAHASWFGGVYQDPKNFFAQMAVEPEEWLAMYPEFRITPEERQKWLATRTGVIVGRKTAERFGFKVGDKIPLQATFWERKDGSKIWEFDLVGIYEGGKKGTDLTQFFFRYDYLDESRAYLAGRVGWYVVRVKDPNEAVAVARRIDAEFANSPSETKAETEGAFLQGYAKQIGDITTIMVGILSAVFFTILLVSGNTMAQAVRERIEEIGVLKALGFTNGQVLVFVLAESCVLATLAGAAGLGLAWLLIARGDPTNGALPVFFFPPERLVNGALLVLALGIISGLLPAVQAMRLKVAEALRRM